MDGRYQGKTTEDYHKARDFHFYKQKYYNENNKSAINALTGMLSESEKFIDAALQPRTADQRPLPKDYAKNPIYRYANKFKEILAGISDEQINWWETKGIAADPSGKQAFGPRFTPDNVQALMKNAGTSLSNAIKILQGKDEEVQALKKADPQKYGQLQVLALINTAALVNAYGPYGLLPGGIMTGASDIMSAMNGALAERPELKGNPIQDVVHSTMWIGGKAAQLAYNKTLGAILPKTQIKDKASIVGSAKKNLKLEDWGKQLDSPELTGLTITFDPNMKKPVREGPQREFKTLSPLDPTKVDVPPTTFIQPGKPVNTGADDKREDIRDDERRIETGGGGPITRVPSDNVPIPSDPRDTPPRTTGPLGMPPTGRETFPKGQRVLGTETTGEPAVFPYKPRGPRLKPTDTKTTLGEDELNELNKLGIVEQRRSDWESQRLLSNADDYNKLNVSTKGLPNWIEHGDKPYTYINDKDKDILLQIQEIRIQQDALYNQGLNADAQDLEFNIIDLNNKLTGEVDKTEITSPVQHYLNGETADNSLKKFQQNLDAVINNKSVENLLGDLDHEQNMQALTDKVYEASLANQAARDEFTKKRQEEASEQNKATGEAAEKLREETKEYIKQAEESGKRIMQGVKIR